MDYVLLPLSVRFFQKKQGKVGLSKSFSKESELDDFEAETEPTPSEHSQSNLIEKITYICIAGYIIFFFLYNLLTWKEPAQPVTIIRTQEECKATTEFDYT